MEQKLTKEMKSSGEQRSRSQLKKKTEKEQLLIMHLPSIFISESKYILNKLKFKKLGINKMSKIIKKLRHFIPCNPYKNFLNPEEWLALREVSKSKYLNVANQSIIMDQNQTKTKYKYCDKSQGGNEEGNNSITLNDNEKAGNHCEVKVLNACLVESQVKNNDESKELDADCSEEDSLCEKDSCPRHMSSSCASRNIFDHHGFQMRPQTLTVYTLDTYTAQNLTVVGSIPWAWLREEKWRLHTFAKYPHNTSKSAILLAEDGFAYIGSGKDSDDTVICFFCRGMKRAWREDEDIRQAHRALSPDCPMVNGTGGGNIPLIAPENVSFGRTQFAAGGQNDIEKDCSPDLSQEAGQAGPNRQHQQHSKAQSGSNKPKAPVQLATYTVMCASSRPQRITQHQAVGNTTALDQASDDRGASSIVTSSNTAPSFVKADDVSGQNHGSQQSAQRQAAAATGHTNPNLPRIGNESRNVPDGGNRPTPTNLLSAPSEPATQSARPSSASQSLPPTTSTPSSTGATVIQSSTPHTVAQSSAPNTATQSPPPNTVTQSTTTPSSQSSTPSTNPPPVPQNPTYLELGIITERPKRYEYAVRIKRLETFGDWPADHHLKKEDLADAGFYYAGRRASHANFFPSHVLCSLSFLGRKHLGFVKSFFVLSFTLEIANLIFSINHCVQTI